MYTKHQPRRQQQRSSVRWQQRSSVRGLGGEIEKQQHHGKSGDDFGVTVAKQEVGVEVRFEMDLVSAETSQLPVMMMMMMMMMISVRTDPKKTRRTKL